MVIIVLRVGMHHMQYEAMASEKRTGHLRRWGISLLYHSTAAPQMLNFIFIVKEVLMYVRTYGQQAPSHVVFVHLQNAF